MLSIRKIKYRWIAVLLLVSANASADWILDNDQSSLYYVTNKAAAIAELNSFGELSGRIEENGNASLIISLASVNTAIEIRDQRVREILFKVAEYSTASVRLMVEADALASMEAGSSSRGPYEAVLTLNGITGTVSAELTVTKLSDDSILIQSAMPLIINALTFGLADGVEELREIVGLPNINNNVVVNFSLLYSKEL